MLPTECFARDLQPPAVATPLGGKLVFGRVNLLVPCLVMASGKAKVKGGGPTWRLGVGVAGTDSGW